MSQDSIPVSASVASVEEVWMPVPGHEGRYSVTALGRVRSEKFASGRGRAGGGRVLKLVRRKGYLYFAYRRPGAKKQSRMGVHQAVAFAFIGPCPAGMEVNHKNGIKDDSRAENLEYMTHGDNSRHARDHGLLPMKRGEDHSRARLTEADVRAIRAEYPGRTQKELAAAYGVHNSHISRILSGQVWGHID